VRLLGEAVADAPGEAVYHAYYARALWQSGAREQALREHDAAVQLNSASVDYRAERAAAYMALGRSEDAALDFSRVLVTQPDNVSALRGLARLKEEGGDHAAAVSLLQRALRVRGTDPEVVQELAYALEKRGDFEQARVYYSNVLALMPDAQITRSRLAETLLAQSQPDEAVRVLEEGVARTPSAPMLRRSLGSLLERSGKIPEAVAAYREYVRLAPNAEDAKALEDRAASLERRLGAAAEPAQEARDTTGG
jgi:Flp pilus assembly protein TadD